MSYEDLKSDALSIAESDECTTMQREFARKFAELCDLILQKSGRAEVMEILNEGREER
jgi:hypothetical protein